MRRVTIQQADSKAEELTVLKANLHTHTTNSDGTFSPSEVIGFYADAGYDVLAFTDHRTTNRVSEYDAEGMTLLSGIELHPAGPRGIPWHILAIGIPENFSCTHPESGQQAVDAVRQAGGVAFAAHPYWCGFTAAEVMTLNGIAGIEVYNTSTRYIGKEYNMTIWDETLDAGRNYTALAVDDVHGKRDLFRGWTMICAKSRQCRDILDALGNGSFYATQGPEFHRISFHDGIFEAEFTPCAAAVLVGRQSSGYCAAIEAPDGPGTWREVSQMRIDLRQAQPGSYFRCQLRDASGRMAWSNPFRI